MGSFLSGEGGVAVLLEADARSGWSVEMPVVTDF
jgi:hypothetical protein